MYEIRSVGLCSLSELCWSLSPIFSFLLLPFSTHDSGPSRKWSQIFCSEPAALLNASPPPASVELHRSPQEPFSCESWHTFENVSRGLRWPEGWAQQRVCSVLYHITCRMLHAPDFGKGGFLQSSQECVFMCVFVREEDHIWFVRVH